MDVRNTHYERIQKSYSGEAILFGLNGLYLREVYLVKSW